MSNHSKYPKGAGIYKFTCLNNGKIYIGKSINLRVRLGKHKHTSSKLGGKFHFEHALVKYGWESFTIEILETFETFDKTNLEDRLMILDRETYYIGLFDSDNSEKGYNKCRYSTDRTGILASDETKEKMRQARLGKTSPMLGRKHSDETKAKMREAKAKEIKGRKRKPCSEKTKEKLRQKTISEEHKENLRKFNTGKKLSQETRDKMSQSRLGKVSPKLGKKLSEEIKEKMRKPKSDEHRAKIIKNLKNIKQDEI